MGDAETDAPCERVGEPMPDIAGIGIIVAFAGQAFISLTLAIWVHFSSRHGKLEVQHAEGTQEHAVEVKRLESILDILMVGNDIQLLTGIALMISAFAIVEEIDLYHLHLIYDTVSFVGVSSAAALITWTFSVAKHPNSSKYTPRARKTPITRRILTSRHRMTYTFSLLFLALAILLEVRLGDWSTDPAAPAGSCFHVSGLLAAPGAAHPAADRVYVAITAAWLLVVMFLAIFQGPARRHSVLLAAVVQFPVHLYAVIALRTGNQAFLESEGGEQENDWDFGQTTAVLLLGVTVHECVEKGKELWRLEKRVKKSETVEKAEVGKAGPRVREEGVVASSDAPS
ncbi:hypothetical protein QBC47DRAFT_408375 [Echria macrotheca]|uniref:Uncharacterized protein n=1 Tax=Echria macrotheca TaxID=438768 RepID=A0AAJ0BLS4_9PEZI|nr:hypothetical protein QBC47DRAFT_408375 [Echria macrotheca]